MTAIRAGDVERAVASRSPEVSLLLFYGPDTGLVTERARAAAFSAVDDPLDPFQLIRMDGEAVADEPGRLIEEATTFGMFGGRRAIWVRSTSRNIATAVQAVLQAPLSDTLVVVEAGDLGKSAPLRSACEGARTALALPCYGDEGRDLASVISDGLAAHGLRIEPDARALLAESLGGDRLASRQEIEKLALYGLGHSTITIADVEAVASDVSSVSADAIIDAAFTGSDQAIESGLRHAAQQGLSIQAVLALALRHGVALLSATSRREAGEDVETLVRSWPRLHFRRKAAVTRTIRTWSSEAARRATQLLQAAVLDSRTTASLADPITARALYAVSSLARRSGG